jgi:signal-transduction protein with cAMP-binding, CBS, and nucleotidyltransferase domain
MRYEDFRDLVMNFEFESFKAGETVFEINSTGETFYIILKGVVRVMVKNPSVRDWGLEFKYYSQLKEWKKRFDAKAKKVE